MLKSSDDREPTDVIRVPVEVGGPILKFDSSPLLFKASITAG